MDKNDRAVPPLVDVPAALSDDAVRARLAAIVESSDDAIISKDLNGIITSWNAAASRIFGYSAEEAIGHPVTMLIPTSRHDEEPSILERIRHGERIDHYETVRQRKDGALIDVSITVSPIRDAHGRVVGASKIARDVTEARRSRQSTLRFYELGQRCVRPGADFTGITGAILDTAMWISRADRGCILLRDSTSGALKIVQHRGLTGTLMDRLAHGYEHAGHAERVLLEDIPALAQIDSDPLLALLHHAGILAMQSTPLFDSRNQIVGVVATFFRHRHRPSESECRELDVLARQAADYLERKRSDEQREELLSAAEAAREDAEAANRAKDEFLAMLGHELRNPLSAVRNSIAAALLDPVAQKHALQIARRQADQLGRIVDDLLDVARITHGRVPLRKDTVSLSDLMQRAADAAQAIMEERGHTLTLTMPSELVVLEVDPSRIEQALGNLLTNAAKFTEPGGTVSIAAERGDGEAVIRVRDTGMGITADVLPRIFDLFTQGGRTLDRSQGGLGIGLTLVRRIVELHGGTIQARSAGAGRGSEFVVRLPALSGVAADSRAAIGAGTPSEPSSRPKRVLIVEDNPDAAESLRLLLQILGHHVRAVHDGLAALEAARANLPDLMLIDIGLPGMDGYELARTIRGDVALKGLLLVALTGYGQPEDRAQATAAGFDYYMVKPIDLDALGQLVSRIGSQTVPGGDTRH